MRILLFIYFTIALLCSSAYATLSTTYVPNIKSSGPPSQSQNGDIVDTGYGMGTGNVGIGTVIPDRLLDVVSSDTNTTITSASLASMGIKNENTTVNNFADMAFSTIDSNGAIQLGSKVSGIFTSHTAGAVSGGIAFLNKTSGTTAEAMRIIGNNVGIGSINPGTSLDVYGTTDNVRFVGIGTSIPQALCRKIGGVIGYYNPPWSGVCS